MASHITTHTGTMASCLDHNTTVIDGCLGSNNDEGCSKVCLSLVAGCADGKLSVRYSSRFLSQQKHTNIFHKRSKRDWRPAAASEPSNQEQHIRSVEIVGNWSGVRMCVWEGEKGADRCRCGDEGEVRGVRGPTCR